MSASWFLLAVCSLVGFAQGYTNNDPAPSVYRTFAKEFLDQVGLSHCHMRQTLLTYAQTRRTQSHLVHPKVLKELNGCIDVPFSANTTKQLLHRFYYPTLKLLVENKVVEKLKCYSTCQQNFLTPIEKKTYRKVSTEEFKRILYARFNSSKELANLVLDENRQLSTHIIHLLSHEGLL